MMKKFVSASVMGAALFLGSVTPAFAEITNFNTDMSVTRSPKASPTATNAAEFRDAVKSRTAQATTDAKNRVASKEAELKDKIASRGAMLKEKLAAFKDRKKAALVEKISEVLANINQRRTSMMLKHIDTMNTLLGRAEERATKAEAAGKDVSAVTAEFTAAKNALANAKTAVDAQSKKTYDINIASESGARADVKATRDMLGSDLKATHNLVAEARRVLMNALVKLAQSMGEGGTTSGSDQ